MNKGLVLVFCFLFSGNLFSQSPRYLVAFRHKGAGTSTIAFPASYLSQRAIERRARYQIAIDSTDLPVPLTWIQQIAAIPNVTVLNSSKWLNMISIQTSDASALIQVSNLPFVQSTASIASRARNQVSKTEDFYSTINTSKVQGQLDDYYNYGTGSMTEINVHKGQFLHNLGLRGQGLRIAMLDGGFFQYTSLRAFDSMNANNQVLGTWDFVDRNTSVVEDNSHGMSCLSTIAANIPGVFTGKAPAASFYLFRTEDVNTEYPIEEFNWACGAERADSVGADIISSSLGYGYGFSGGFPDYPYSDLNGDITISARAADLAAAKGLLVFNAAGNSGNDYWKRITTPADADSVVAVGAANTAGVVGSFSSYGPSADGRVKPDVASIGVAAMIQASNNSIVSSNGTSYACPNMAGLATCLWQGFPEFSNMRIVQALREAGSIYTTPDTRIGYGIPDMKKAFVSLLKEYAAASVTISNCEATVNWATKDVPAMRYEIYRKSATDADYVKLAEIQAHSGSGSFGRNMYAFSFGIAGLPAGPVSYRILQVVDTAAATYTAFYIGDVITATVESICPDQGYVDMIRLAPNPVTGPTATIIFNNASSLPQLKITVFDMKGAQVMEVTGSKLTGLYRHELDVAHLAKGKYIIRISDGNKKITSLDLLRL
ncbi:MAG: T9SS type A sorting domain-containing protein [Chitinophagaceae bacterium]|nr:MAG: T9SS type A sorting domain-containing protein [Chitinophagaceae bacterium]